MFRYFNPNPRGKIAGDCVIRAISKATGKSWRSVYRELCAVGSELGDMPSANPVWGAYLRQLGFERHTVPNTCPDCYTVRDFCDEHPYGTYILATGSHAVAVVDGDYYDIWDSGDEMPTYLFLMEE